MLKILAFATNLTKVDINRSEK